MFKHLRLLFTFVGISGTFSVLFSAWLAHAGSSLMFDEQRRLVIALAMQFIHTLALLVVLVWLKLMLATTNTANYSNKFLYTLLITAYCFFVGILFFSGALYFKAFHLTPFFGKLAPFGGSTLALGWLMLAVSAQFRK
ncbi:MAG: DUF423 domain-containing protein [Alteromonadaceae bacterium]|nr:DUF423 domain-containing protein [Alteromonadaceae bacterium]